MLAPGSVIGILGGGQLGRMLALAAAEMGMDVHVFAPDANSPAFRVAAQHTCAPYVNLEAVERFAQACDVVTLEFENVPLVTAQAVEATGVPLRPGVKALEVAQDRLIEKQFFQNLGAETVPIAAVDSLADLQAGAQAVGLPAILKTRREGYDGKGQLRLQPGADLSAAYDTLQKRPAILEGYAPFVREFSVIVARGVDGAMQAYEAAENVHEGGILRTSTVPGGMGARSLARGVQIAQQAAEALGYIGVLAVEFFELADGKILVNECAPRVHNSGHWTQDGCATSQFSQHIRAISGWPLAVPDRHADVMMLNVIGAAAEDWTHHLDHPHAHLHYYGKNQWRDGRKMAHINLLKNKS